MHVLDLAYIALLLVLDAFCVFLVALSLPGTWLLLLFTALVAWLRWEDRLFGPASLVILAGLAVLGEVLELVTGALGAKKAGASVWGAIGAMSGGVVGGISGTFFVPVIGSILGAAAGAFGGALLCERLAGRDLEAAAASGRGAFVGRLLGTLSKLVIAALMWIVVAFACFL